MFFCISTKQNTEVALFFINVSGVAGIGKTMWSKKLCHDWLQQVPPLDHFKFVFRIVLSKVNSDIPIEQVILEQTKAFKDKYTTQDIAKLLDLYGKDTLLLIDGYDEFKREKNEDIQKLLTNESKYSNLTILLTSRPEVVTSEFENNFEFIGELCGFTEDSRQKIMTKFLKDQTAAETFQKELKTKDIDDLSYHPLFCVMLLVLYQKDQSLPATRTLIIQSIVHFIIKRNFKRYKDLKYKQTTVNEILTKLGHHAWLSLLDSSVILNKVGMIS